MHGNMPKRIRPKTLENRIRYVLDRNGVTRQQADAIWYSLVTGLDPMPEGVPESFIFRRVQITWPQGVALRMMRPDERKQLNLALEANGSSDQLDSECNASEGRLVYETLWHKTQMPGYEDPTTAQAQFDALVAEAEYDTRIHCDSSSPKGLRCEKPAEHDGRHKQGRTTWGPKTQDQGPTTQVPPNPLSDLTQRINALRDQVTQLTHA